MSAFVRSSSGVPLRRWIAALVVGTACALVPRSGLPDAPGPASAAARLPVFAARDLSGRGRSVSELSGRRSLLVVVPDAEAGDAAERWARSVHELGADVEDSMFTVVALRLPFFVPDGIVLDRARARTPASRWSHTWLDRDGHVRDALGLRGGSRPWVFVLDRDGSVLLRACSDADASSVRAAIALLRG